MSHTLAFALAFAAIATVHAADVGIYGKKLTVADSTAVNGRAKVLFLAKGAAIAKGPGGDPGQIEAELALSYDGASGTFLAPRGSGWLLDKPTVAKYLNRFAPAGGAVRVTLLKPAKLIKLLAKSLGDTPLDVSKPPTTGVLAVYTVTSGGDTTRHCTLFTSCRHEQIIAGFGYKLGCKEGVPAACP